MMGNLRKFEPKKRHLSPGETQNLLMEEITQLQKELESQTVVRSALEKAMTSQPVVDDPAYRSLSQPAENLVKEIGILEVEVVNLEKYLLSLYRRNFAKRASNLPPVDEGTSASSKPDEPMIVEVSETHLPSVLDEESPIGRSKCDETLDDSGFDISHSSLSQCSASSFRSSPPYEAVAEAVDSYHSLPLSMLERAHHSAANARFGQYLCRSFPSRVRETPNWVSEEMIKRISTVYYHLSDPPLLNHGLYSSSLSSPPSELSVQGSSDQNPLYVPSLCTMIEIQGISRDSQRLKDVEDLLQNFRFLISRLAITDPGALKNEEKLAFWINIHNALVMHAFLVYGIPRGNLKRISSVLKAAYNIGGHTMSVETIQNSILGCRLPRPAQWLHNLLFSRPKFKTGDARKAYSIKHPESRLRFSLCSGCQSDPAVRLYTPRKVFEDLEMAKEEYIQTNLKLQKEQRLLLPKNVECFVKETGLSPSGMAEMLDLSMPESLRNKFQQPLQGKHLKRIDWIPHNFTFRFLLSHELVR